MPLEGTAQLPPSAPLPRPPEAELALKRWKTWDRPSRESVLDWLMGGTSQGRRWRVATTRRNPVSGNSTGQPAAAMATAKRLAAPPLWPAEPGWRRCFLTYWSSGKPRGSEPELATPRASSLASTWRVRAKETRRSPRPAGGVAAGLQLVWAAAVTGVAPGWAKCECVCTFRRLRRKLEGHLQSRRTPFGRPGLALEFTSATM